MTHAYAIQGTLALARSTVDRVSERRNDPGWLEEVWSDRDTRVLTVADGRVGERDGALVFRSPQDVPPGERYLLGVEDGVAYAAVHTTPELQSDGATLRECGDRFGDRDAGLAVHAIALANWHATHTHCPRCGTATVVRQGGHVRQCPADGSEHYPRVDPAVIMLVTDPDDRCLLGRQAKWPGQRYSTLAGFVEPGETPEHAVAREVAEEVGVRVDSCQYAGAQPWPFPSSLMLGYYATAPADEPCPDGEEIEDARWFTRDELRAAVAADDVQLPSSISIAHGLISGWLNDPGA